LEFLFSPPLPKLEAKADTRPKKPVSAKQPAPADLSSDIISLLRAPNIASKEGIVRTYDTEVQGNTIVKPFQYPGSGPNDAAVLRPIMNSERALVISCGYNPRLSRLDTYWMAAASIDEAVRNNIAAGGRRIALLDNFAWGNPEDRENLGKLVRAARACYDVAKGLETPFVSGKDSLYNETPLGDILPTLVITALGIVPELSRSMSADFKKEGNSIYLVGETKAELGGSEYFVLKNLHGGEVPKLDTVAAASLYKTVNRLTDQSYVRACHDISQGGLVVSLAEMCFARGLGAEIILENSDSQSNLVAELFSESNSRFLLEVDQGEEDKFEKMLRGFPYTKLGKVAKDRIQVKNESGKKLVDVSTKNCYAAWRSTFSSQ
jgi:phosphoribosylformylglycinamidine synthase